MKLVVSEGEQWPVTVGWEDSRFAVAHFFGVAGEVVSAKQDAERYCRWRNGELEKEIDTPAPKP